MPAAEIGRSGEDFAKNMADNLFGIGVYTYSKKKEIRRSNRSPFAPSGSNCELADRIGLGGSRLAVS